MPYKRNFNHSSRIILVIVLALLAIDCGTKKKEQIKPMEKIIATHSIGLCNMPIFILAEKQFAKVDNVEVDLKYIPNWGDHAAALKSGSVDISVTPFTNVITAYANGMPIKIIAGSGINGLYLLGQKGIKTIKQLKHKKIGTFRSDTLELIAFDAFTEAGLSNEDYEMIYFTDGFALMAAFANKEIDAMTQVEPYATQAEQKYGAEIIIKGQDVWNGNHPDCVLVASDDALKNKRASLKAIIAGMLRAEAFIEKEYNSAVDLCVGKYYKADKNDILLAGHAQPPGIDIRDKKQFILDRSKSLMQLGYISKPVDENIFDFSLLEEVISEHPELLDSVKYKSTVVK